MRNISWLLAALLLIAPGSVLGQTTMASQPGQGDLSGVVGIEYFVGSRAGRRLLAKNGFVVTDRQFKQIFSAYLEHALPRFITTDSAWHTYHVLLEEGVRRMEDAQAARLTAMSRELLAAIGKRAAVEAGWNDLADFVTVGLALQDGSAAKALDPKREDLAKAMRTIRGGSGMVEFSIGLPLMAERFRPVSFYTKSPAMRAYYAALQWYGAVDFRLSNPKETAAAVKLALLIDGEPRLKSAYERLTKVYDGMLGPPEDGDVALYASAARKVLGGDVSATAVEKNIEAIGKELASRLADPKVNDQFLEPAQYARFAKYIKGFRLLPSRQLSCAVCFHNTVDPKIQGRMFPSGLDFFAACKELRSPAALRALEAREGKAVADAIAAAECPQLGESLHNQAMKLLAELQKPVASGGPRAMKTDAWSDKQLWTQLGAWAEQRHTWGAHAKLTWCAGCMLHEYPGIVSPYPDFFAGLGRLSAATADAFTAAEAIEQMDARAVATRFLDYSAAYDKFRKIRKEQSDDGGSSRIPEDMAEKVRKLNEAVLRVFAVLSKKAGQRVAWREVHENIKAAARRVSAGEGPTRSDLTLLRLCDNATDEITQRLRSFAKVCDTLAAISRKQIAGKALAKADKEFIWDYGPCIGKHQLYNGDSYLAPRDDFPMVTPVFVNPIVGRTFYVGLARPLALYVVAEVNGKPVLHLGAVLNYREFHQPTSEPLNDTAWIGRIEKGQAPPAPALTGSFLRAVTVAEIIAKLRAGDSYQDIDAHDDREITLVLLDILEKGGFARSWQNRWLVEHLAPRCMEADLPRILRLVSERPMEEIRPLACQIERLNWREHRDELMKLFGSNVIARNDLAARCFAARPQDVDLVRLAATLDKADVRHRRLCCHVMGHQKRPDPAVKRTLLRALGDKDGGVRWQAAKAFVDAGWGDADIFKALAAALADKNEYVAAMAARALVAVKAPDSGRLLLTRLGQLESPKDDEDQTVLDEMDAAISDAHVYSSVLEDAAIPDRLASALIEALGKLPYKPAVGELTKRLEGSLCTKAIRALGRIDPDGQVDRLMGMTSSPEGSEAVRALRFLSLEDREGTFVGIARNAKAHPMARCAALTVLRDRCNPAVAPRLADLLKDETEAYVETVVTSTSEDIFDPGKTEEVPWRICDVAAYAIADLLDWPDKAGGGQAGPKDRMSAMQVRARKWAAALPATAPATAPTELR